LYSSAHEIHERTTKTRNFRKRKSKICSAEVGRFASNPQINKMHEKESRTEESVFFYFQKKTANIFFDLGVRGRDFGAERPAVEISFCV